MANEIEVFEHEMFGSIRIVDQNDEPWFVARDVALALGYTDTDQAIRKHCNSAKPLDVPPVSTAGPTFGGVLKVIPESDMYYLVLGSRKPEAKEFKRWVCEEVLPSIRKTGSYSPPETTLPMDTFPKLLPAWKASRELAELHGFVGNQAILTADKAIKRAHGVDLVALMGGTNPVADKQDQVFTS